MSYEADLYALLKGLVGNRMIPDVAPIGTAHPYITWQAVGGQSLRFLDNTAGDKRNTRLQINTWAKTRPEATAIARQIEDALCATSLFTATPLGEAVSDYDSETKTYGAMQDFSVYSTR